MKKNAQAIAEVRSGVILATVEIAVPPERVFRALTESDEIVRWWGSDDSYRTTRFTAAVRPGGAWRSEGLGPDGQQFVVEGEHIEVDRPHKEDRRYEGPVAIQKIL